MCAEQSVEIVANIASIAGAVISVLVYRRTVKRERQILTIEVFSKIREKFSDERLEEDKQKYLREMEFFCLSINEGVYDFKVLQKMSGKRLREEYQTEWKDYIACRREELDSATSWIEYERGMERLKCHYCSKKNWFLKLFCKKRS